jgi:antagonist of KipI
MTTATVRVIEPGLLTTIQDARGRPGLGRFGIPPGGALDRTAAALANRLVGNGADAAVLEMTLQGPVLEWVGGAHLALTGADLGATAAGIARPPGHAYRLGSGTTLQFTGRRVGARAYLAVQGGFDVPEVLGSVSTDRRSGFGGLDGRPLRAGDVLRFGGSQDRGDRVDEGSQVGALFSAVLPMDAADAAVRVVVPPSSLGWFDDDAAASFCEATWTVAPDSDRNGIRLTGATLARGGPHAGIPSLGIPVGAIQVPPSGDPIVTLADGPVTGGYPVIGVVARRDHGRLAQAAPGTTLRFVAISVEAARRLANPDHEPRLVVDDGDLAAGWAR